MKTVMLVFGTRPEAIKMCPLVKEFQRHPEEFNTIICVTGQHREMLDQVLNIFDVKPDYDLNIMKPGQDLYDVTARVDGHAGCLQGMQTGHRACPWGYDNLYGCSACGILSTDTSRARGGRASYP